MTIYPTVRIEAVRGGVAARTPEIGLAAHGRDTARALASVRIILGIWARALHGQGELELTLARLGVEWEGSGREITVEPRVLGDTG